MSSQHKPATPDAPTVIEYQAAPNNVQPELMPFDEWVDLGKRLFGEDRNNWQFICPSCGGVQTPGQMLALGQERDQAFYSCIGRFDGHMDTPMGEGTPCNYTSGGLFNICDKGVITRDGTAFIFAFAVPVPPAKVAG